ncbi:MAG: hypothetical protein P4M09_03040 [Devosia sp.]|nr:hypothetical protein [Devosia sp.]
MPAVITEQSTVVCPHTGQAQLSASQSKLKVAGAAVLVDGDMAGKSISACTTQPDPNTKTVKCLHTAPQTAGVATKLIVGGKGVLLETAKGRTDGKVLDVFQNWSVQSAGQSKLVTI